MRATKDIDREISELRGKMASLEQEKGEKVRIVDAATLGRKKSAFLAHSQKDTKAQERLTKARAVQRDAELELEDLISASEEGGKKLENLRAEREEAHRQEKLAEWKTEAEEAVGEATELERAIEAAMPLFVKHRDRFNRMSAIAQEAGIQSTNIDLRHFERSLAAKFHDLDPHAFPRRYPAATVEAMKNYEARLRRVIQNALTNNQSEEKAA